MLRRRLLLASLALPAAGCVPAPYGVYFRPASDAPSQLSRAWCQGQAGPVTRIEQAVAGGTTLEASVEREPGERSSGAWILRVRLDLDAQSRYRFEGDALRLTALAGGQRIEAGVSVRVRRLATLARHETVDPVALHPTAGIVGDAAGPATPRGRLELVGPIGVAPQRWRLDTPGLLVGGRRAAPLSIEMQRVPGRSVRTDYREPALQARLEACRAAPAPDDCARGFPQGSFERNDGAVTWQGRWDHFENRYDRRPVHGLIDVRVADRLSWRWVDGDFTLNDLDTGGLHRLEAGALAVELEDRIALATPLRPAPHPARARTSLWIEARLPGDVPGFELRWPALAIDDRRVELAAIRFERRAFDGGIEPFNC